MSESSNEVWKRPDWLKPGVWICHDADGMWNICKERMFADDCGQWELRNPEDDLICLDEFANKLTTIVDEMPPLSSDWTKSQRQV